MTSFELWKKWLLLVCIVIIAFGAMLAFLSGTPLFDLFNKQFSAPFWGAQALTGTELSYQHWVYGVLGATMIGWGIFLIFVVWNPFDKKESWAWNSIIIGILTWFVIDTGISTYYAVYANVLLNTVILILALIPMVMTRRDFS